LLIFIVIVAIYAIGAIIKSQASKFEEEDKDKQRPEPYTPTKARQRANALKQYLRSVAEQASQPSAEQTSAKKQGPRKKIPAAPAPGYKRPAKKPAFSSDIKKETLLGKPIRLDEILVDESRKEPAAPLKETEITAEEQSLVSELFNDFMQTDDLQKAILHYEILGKPISIRTRSDDIF